MCDFTDSSLVRNDRTLVLAHDHGPKQFAGVEERLDPREVFGMATHDAVTALAVGKGLAETYYPSYEDDVNLLAKLNGGSDLWMGDPYSPKNWAVDYAAELGADAIDCEGVDTVGAGDALLSGVLSAIDAGADEAAALRTGVVAATAAVSTPGTNVPDLPEPGDGGVETVSEN